MTSVFVALGIILITKWVYDALIRISPGARLPIPLVPKQCPSLAMHWTSPRKMLLVYSLSGVKNLRVSP